MDHRAFFDRWFRVLWGERDQRIIDECVSDTCRIEGLPDTEWGRKSFHQFFEVFGSAFPRVRVEVEDCLSVGEQFAIRCRGAVVDKGGRTHEFTGLGMGRIRDGQIVEAWNQWNFLALLESMGVVRENVFGQTLLAEAKK